MRAARLRRVRSKVGRAGAHKVQVTTATLLETLSIKEAHALYLELLKIFGEGERQAVERAVTGVASDVWGEFKC